MWSYIYSTKSTPIVNVAKMMSSKTYRPIFCWRVIGNGISIDKDQYKAPREKVAIASLVVEEGRVVDMSQLAMHHGWCVTVDVRLWGCHDVVDVVETVVVRRCRSSDKLNRND